MTKILTTAQAEAVYSAMCTLNNVSAKLIAGFHAGNGVAIVVKEQPLGRITITRGSPSTGDYEEHPSQSAFATAYGLAQG